MKRGKKKLETLLEGGFRPLERKEDKLRGGFGTLESNSNCFGTCKKDDQKNRDCPQKQTPVLV